ncbi:MFS transporter [Allosphingosinicella indica]|uniref:Predicted arabinose efflux permease, MFS family n=1 Tax=Allosphingosinicella indica TaxID=941907 RepID=A0A1X7FZ21_9SPHN|nr:MFS transporter [Allosphingosinicella indica]SMF61370.1 Predicted arabinose efflux permease, MFS family [Allosphingosinicella indica]
MAETSPFQFRDYRFFWAARLTSTIANTMLVVVLGIHVYDIARLTMSIREASFWLGMVGLAQFLPLFLLTLAAGYIADRIDRRWIVRAAIGLELICAAALAALVWLDAMSLAPLFAVAVALGIGRAFAGPALSAIAPNIVPPALLPSAIALNSIAWQAGAVAGPLIGGGAYALSIALPYEASALLYAVAFVAMLMIRPIPLGKAGASRPLRAVIEGLAYVRNNKIVLGAITLDLFAVLLGGATAMLPVFARDILHVGSEGLGALRAAPAVGAALTALILARRPIQRRVGAKMFVCVAIFGLATIVFGESRVMWLSLAALFVIGASDMISVYVRQSLIQLHTPDAMRGRVSAVSGLFISASNELGEFRAGLAGSAVGPVAAVVGGGALAVAATGLCAWAFPSLRRADRFVAPDAASLMKDPGKDRPDVELPPLVAGLDPKAEKGLP